MRNLILALVAVAAASSGCVVETSTGCPGGCPVGSTCGTDGICHSTMACPSGCPMGTTCGADGLCHASGPVPAYSTCTSTSTCATGTSCVSVSTPSTTGGSFCSLSPCAHGTDCAPGAHGLASACLMIAAGGGFACFPGCSTDADCALGTSCIPVTGGAVGSVCMPGSPISTTPHYGTCSSSAMCGSGDSCVTITTGATSGGSFCSLVNCTTSAQCAPGPSGLGGACLMLASAPGSAFVCYPGCNTDGDCLTGSSCIPVTGGATGHVCMPGSPISLGQDYDHCNVNSDCASNLCTTVSVTTTGGAMQTGNQCTEACSSSSACPDRRSGGVLGAACLMLAGTSSGFFCYQGCSTTADCFGSSTCLPVTGGASGSACFPNG